MVLFLEKTNQHMVARRLRETPSSLEGPAVHPHRNRYFLGIDLNFLFAEPQPAPLSGAYGIPDPQAWNCIQPEDPLYSEGGKGVGAWPWDPLRCTAYYPEAASLIGFQNGFLKAQMKPRSNTVNGWGAILQDAVYVFNQRPLGGTESPTGRIYQSGNWEMADGVGPLSITPNDPTGGFCIVHPCTFRLEPWSPKGRALFAEDTESSHWTTSQGCHWTPLVHGPIGKKWSHDLGRIIDPDQQEDLGLPLHKEGRKECLHQIKRMEEYYLVLCFSYALAPFSSATE